MACTWGSVLKKVGIKNAPMLVAYIQVLGFLHQEFIQI